MVKKRLDEATKKRLRAGRMLLTGKRPAEVALAVGVARQTVYTVEQLTKSILESGELKDAGNYYEYAGTTHRITIPATLRDSLMARLDRFMPVKEIAQIGAAIGREFSYELISALTPMPQTQLDSALAQLTDSGLAFRRGAPPEATS